MLCYLPVREGTLHKIQDCNHRDAALKALASVIRGQQSAMMMAASFEAG